MDELLYVWSLGFSPADTMRGITAALFVSLLVVKAEQVWRYTLLALAVDRLFPIVASAIGGERFSDVWATAAASVGSIGADLGVMTIRYVVMFAVIHFAFVFRANLHSHLAKAK